MTQPDAELVFDALGDPSRRRIVILMSQTGPVTATGLAEDLQISRQAVAKHLTLLRDAGLATAERVGRETRFRLIPGGFESADEWLRAQQANWGQRLDRFQHEMEQRRQE